MLHEVAIKTQHFLIDKISLLATQLGLGAFENLDHILLAHLIRHELHVSVLSFAVRLLHFFGNLAELGDFEAHLRSKLALFCAHHLISLAFKKFLDSALLLLSRVDAVGELHVTSAICPTSGNLAPCARRLLGNNRGLLTGQDLLDLLVLLVGRVRTAALPHNLQHFERLLVIICGDQEIRKNLVSFNAMRAYVKRQISIDDGIFITE